jgi:hypothetical protein
VNEPAIKKKRENEYECEGPQLGDIDRFAVGDLVIGQSNGIVVGTIEGLAEGRIEAWSQIITSFKDFKINKKKSFWLR